MPCPNCHCPSCLALIDLPIPSNEFSPPPSELMAVNRAPTDSEVAYCRDVISSSEKTISLIRAMVDNLEKQKNKLLGLISTHNAAISSLRYFPPELLAEIFAQAVEDHWNPKCPSPLTLMGICSRWRRIVLDTPRLWTKISSLHPMIDAWITRSKDLPLHLGLDLSQPASHPILEALIPHSPRWESARFSLGPSSPSILSRVRTRLHSLKQLSLSFDEATGTVDFFEVAPQLTCLSLGEIHEPVIIKLPQEQLKVCVVDNSEVAHYVLQNTGHLRGLHLIFSDISASPWLEMPREPHSHHLRLESLIIKWKHVDTNINFFFSSITLPSLRALDICFDQFDADETSDFARAYSNPSRADLGLILISFFERSCAHLEMLKLTDIPFHESSLTECLTCAPSLMSLDIEFDERWYAIDQPLLDRLNVNHPRHILPRLRSLAFWGAMDTFAGKSLDALIASRRHIDPKHNGVVLLENLTLEGRPPIWFKSRPLRFHRFVSEGLNVTYGKDWEGFH